MGFEMGLDLGLRVGEGRSGYLVAAVRGDDHPVEDVPEHKVPG